MSEAMRLVGNEKYLPCPRFGEVKYACGIADGVKGMLGKGKSEGNQATLRNSSQ